MRRTILIVSALFLLFGIVSFSFAAEEPKQDTSSSAPTQSSSEDSLPTFSDQASEEFVSGSLPENTKTVTAIEIKGNKNISTNIIVSKMKTRIGSPYLENVISDDLKRLYLLGFFSDIKIDTESYKDGVKVIVRVSERPIIEKITFSGIIHITMKDEKLKAQLKSKEGQYLDYPTLQEDVRILQKMYEKIGFSDAGIEPKVDLDKEKNKAKIEFVVNENRKVKIKDIYIIGNKAFKTQRILKLIKTRKAWLLNAGVIKDDVLKEDIERIKTFYHRNGYTDVIVTYDIKPDTKKSYFLYITITIEEGKKYLVGNVIVDGNKDIAEKVILGALKECNTGKVFSEEGVKDDVSNIQSLYFDKGYISVAIQNTTSVNPKSGRVDIAYKIIENQIAYVDKIRVKGNIKTRDIVIRRELRIHPGDRFDGQKLKRSKERLQNLGFFDEVSYDTEDTDVPDQKDLVVDVKESKTGSFSFGGGYSTVDQFVGFVEVEQKNFDWKNFPYFSGAGQDLKFRGSFGTITSGYTLSFTNPWIFDYPMTGGFDAYRNTHQRDEDVGYGYDQEVTGGDLRFGKELTEYISGGIVYRWDQIKISNISTGASNDLMQEQGTNNVSSLTPSLAFDTRDNVFNTHKGDLVTGSLQWAGGMLGGTKDFWKFYGRASHYIPLFRESTLEIKGRVGFGKPYSDSDRIPIYERYFAGGATTIRGYDERMVGPIDPLSQDPLGGNAMMIGNIEYQYPLFSFLKVAAFYDVGNVWGDMKDLGSGGFKSGIGFGARIKTPVGPMAIDYGIPMSKQVGSDTKKGGQFYFSASKDF